MPYNPRTGLDEEDYDENAAPLPSAKSNLSAALRGLLAKIPSLPQKDSPEVAAILGKGTKPPVSLKDFLRGKMSAAPKREPTMEEMRALADKQAADEEREKDDEYWRSVMGS